MTPDEAKQTLLEAGIFSKWEGRRLVGGSTYRPGNPGVFEGIRFTITLVELGVCTAEVTDFQDQTKELQVAPNLRSLAEGDRKDLGWAIHSVLEELGKHLDHGKGEGPKVPLSTAMELCREYPEIRSETALLSRLLFVNKIEEGKLREGAALARYEHVSVEPGLTEQQRITSDLSTKVEVREWQPPVVMSGSAQKFVTAVSKKVVSYGHSDAVETGKAQQRYLRSYHWAPLDAKESWPSALRPVPPYDQLSVPRKLSIVVFMSAVRQVLEDTPEWLELIVFSTDPADGMVTACFLATRVDPPKARKPQWLLDLASPAEKSRCELEEQLSREASQPL